MRTPSAATAAPAAPARAPGRDLPAAMVRKELSASERQLMLTAAKQLSEKMQCTAARFEACDLLSAEADEIESELGRLRRSLAALVAAVDINHSQAAESTGAATRAGDLSVAELERLTRCRSHADFHRLRKALRIPAELTTVSGYVCSGEEAFLVVLARLATTGTLDDLRRTFDRSRAALSEIIHHMLDLLHGDYYEPVLLGLDRWREWAAVFSHAIAVRAPDGFEGCIGFIDGHLQFVRRPSWFESQVFNGHKWRHGLKYLAIVSPCGLATFAWGAEPGSRHDAFLVSSSELEDVLRDFNDLDPTQLYFVLGDAAFPNREHIMVRGLCTFFCE